MKKKSTFILLFLSSFLLCQSWDSNENRFNNSNGKSDDELLYKKNESATKQDVAYIKNTINKTGFFYDYFNQKEDEALSNNQQSPSLGPGAPGEPLPIDRYEVFLFLIGMILILSSKKIRRINKKFIINND